MTVRGQERFNSAAKSHETFPLVRSNTQSTHDRDMQLTRDRLGGLQQLTEIQMPSTESFVSTSPADAFGGQDCPAIWILLRTGQMNQTSSCIVLYLIVYQ